MSTSLDSLTWEVLPDEVDRDIAEKYKYPYYAGTIKSAVFGKGKYFLPYPAFIPLAESINKVKVRPDDVWIGGFPRSGTHWLAELSWLLNNNLDFETAKSIHHEQRVWYFDFSELVIYKEDPDRKYQELLPDAHVKFFEPMPSPRFLKTHLPPSLLPAKLLDTAKMVYIARDPRDVIVSSFHTFQTHVLTPFLGTFKEYFRMFIDGHCVYSPYFNSVKEYWAQKDNPNLLFLFYEDLYKDLPATARRVAKFYNKEYCDDQYDQLCLHLKFTSMKKNKSINYMDIFGENKTNVVRKGVAGGWRSEFDDEMILEAEKWIEDNLRDTDLRFPSL